jgi:hypothetical protein
VGVPVEARIFATDIDASDARENIGGYEDHAELYVRWFEYGTFQPTMRAHGSRKQGRMRSRGLSGTMRVGS